MVPIVTPDEMRAADAAADVPEQVLIERAGGAVARAAIRMLGGTYGRVVNVVAGKGNNGADGRVAAERLTARGVKVRVFEAAECPPTLPDADLVIDAAYGTGFHGTWEPPDPGDAAVLAVDIPSGVDALTGAVAGPVLRATRTVTFQALKPGLLVPPGSELCGAVEVADIGLDDEVAARAGAHLVQGSDVAGWLQDRATDSHKWKAAVRVVAGGTGMSGAARLAAHAAMRAGAGMVQLSSPGSLVPDAPAEVVQQPIPTHGWAATVLDHLDRFHALVVGPGLGRNDATTSEVCAVVVDAPVPVVVDGDGLFAMAWNADGAAALLRRRQRPTVLTPHDGEYALLSGSSPRADRLAAARRLAADTGAVVLLKGPATVVADPSGATLVVTTGDERLATAGTGDVLSGVIGALLAQGTNALFAAAAGAWLHGRAARLAPERGMVAGDIADHLPQVFDDVHGRWGR